MNVAPLPSALSARALPWLALVLLAWIALSHPSQAAQPGASARLVAPSQVALGQPFRVALVVDDATTLAGYEATLRFDTAAAHLTGLAQRDNDLSRAGRGVAPLGPVLRPDGAAFGLVSCAAECVSGAGEATARGVAGTVRLATVHLVADQPGTLELRLDGLTVVDASGNALAAEGATVSVQVGAGGGPRFAAPAGGANAPSRATTAPEALDATGDGRVDHADLMELAMAWTRARQSGAACALADGQPDANGDGCLTVADLQATAAALSPARAAPASPAQTFAVTSTGDGPDNNIGNGICATDGGGCTLRAAIHEANAQPGPNTIAFAIPGAGPHTIQLTKPLTTLNDATGPTTLDGYTQPGAQPNSDPLASNAAIQVQIEGAGEDDFEALRITTAGNVVRGLAFFRVQYAVWLYGDGATGNRIVGNFIGTDAAASYAAPEKVNTARAVHVELGASENEIGGTALVDRNVVSGNALHGVALWHEGTARNRIVNNILGLRPDGGAQLANRGHGLDVNFGASDNILGGLGPNERNVSSGNRVMGIEISHGEGTRGNQVVGNFVGTDLSGTSAPAFAANGEYGVRLEDGVTANVVAHNRIGGSALGGIVIHHTYTTLNHFYANHIGVGVDGTPMPNHGAGIEVEGSQNLIGPDNHIAHNDGAGISVTVAGALGNTLSQNQIWSNGGLGIDLAPIGSVNPNDLGDGDGGANDGLNFPALTSATPTLVEGRACAGCIVEIFVADGGLGAHGEGRAFVGSATAGGDGTFAAPVSDLLAGSFVTATATDGEGNTSEFARNFFVAAQEGGEPCCTMYLPLVFSQALAQPATLPNP